MSERFSALCRPPLSGWLVPVGAVAFSCGVILLYRSSVLPAPEWLLLPMAAGFYIFFRFSSPYVKFLAWLLSCALVGAAWASLQAEHRLSGSLPADLEGKQLRVEGYVCTPPTRGSFDSLRFSFCVTRWPGLDGQRLPETLRLSWYGGNAGRLADHRLGLEVVLKRPHGALNSAGFRYEDWLFRHGIQATGSVRSVQAVPGACGAHCRYVAVHHRLARWAAQVFGPSEHYPLIASLMIGNRSGLQAEHWEVLKATGTIHLVAISGLHLGLVAIGAALLVRSVTMTRLGRRLSERHCRLLVYWGMIAACVLYALCSGFAVPTRRALVMVAIAGWAVLCGRSAAPWRGLALGLFVVTLMDPFAPLDQGFWLSFGAVACLVLAFAGRLRQPGWLNALWLAQLAVFLGLWPLLVAFGQGQPVAGLLANLVAIPWVSFVVMPVVIVGGLLVAVLPALAGPVATVIDGAVGLLWTGLSQVAEWPWPVLMATPVEAMALAVTGLVLIRYASRDAVVVSVLLFGGWVLLSVGTRPEAPADEAPRLTVLDVGQGLSVLVQSGRQVLVYDTGPAVAGVFSAVQSTLLPVLRQRGIDRIDTLVISHGDNDHAGGLEVLLRAIPVGRVVTGEPVRIGERLAEFPDTRVVACAREPSTLGRLALHYWRTTQPASGNDASCVLSITDPDTRVQWLIPGDISRDTERQFLAQADGLGALARPDARIVLAPHHGSKTSSSPSWIEVLSPDLVIYSAGYRHRFGHPHPAVTRRYRDAGAQALSTACSGAIDMRATAQGLEISEARAGSPFWIGGAGLTRDDCKIP